MDISQKNTGVSRLGKGRGPHRIGVRRSKKNKGKHGLLFIPATHTEYPYKIIFSSRLEVYLSLLNYLPLSVDRVDSLPKVDMEFTVPTQILNIRSAPTGSSKL